MLQLRHLSGAEPAGRGLPRERRRGRRDQRPPRPARRPAAKAVAGCPPSRASSSVRARGASASAPRALRAHTKPPPAPHRPAAADRATEGSGRRAGDTRRRPLGALGRPTGSRGPPRSQRSRLGRAGGGRGEDHVNGLRSLSAAQVSGRGCVAGGRRGCCGDAGHPRPRAAPPPPDRKSVV